MTYFDLKNQNVDKKKTKFLNKKKNCDNNEIKDEMNTNLADDDIGDARIGAPISQAQFEIGQQFLIEVLQVRKVAQNAVQLCFRNGWIHRIGSRRRRRRRRGGSDGLAEIVADETQTVDEDALR